MPNTVLIIIAHAATLYRQEATAATAAAAPSEESSSLSPASRVLAMADKVADDEDGGEATSEGRRAALVGPL